MTAIYTIAIEYDPTAIERVLPPNTSAPEFFGERLREGVLWLRADGVETVTCELRRNRARVSKEP